MPTIIEDEEYELLDDIENDNATRKYRDYNYCIVRRNFFFRAEMNDSIPLISHS